MIQFPANGIDYDRVVSDIAKRNRRNNDKSDIFLFCLN